jgi:lincosamide nucleotidyltransferase A/C/D/E
MNSDDRDENSTTEPTTGPTTEAAQVLAVLVALRAGGCRVWVAGGWGVDILVGRQTRPHRDLDLAIDAAGLDTGLAVLAQLGYSIETDWLPVRVELGTADRGWVDLHPVVFDQQGDGVQAGFDGEVFRYPAADLVSGSLNGIEIGCLSRELQLSFRQGYELRDVDHHDLGLLNSLI